MTTKYIVGKNEIPKNVSPSEVSDGDHTFEELYEHRVLNFLALMKMSAKAGLEVGWSKRHHENEELVFGGGWVVAWITAPSGIQARYHMKEGDYLPPDLEKEIGSPWNGQEEAQEALRELIFT